MGIYPNYVGGQRLTAADLAAGQFLIVTKAANTDRASTASPADDPDLQFDLAESSVYAIEFFLQYACITAAGFITAWRIPSGATGNKGIQGAGSSATDTSANNISMRSGVHGVGTFTASYGSRASATNQLLAYEECMLTTSAAGEVALQWAQNSSNATATRLGAGSWARCLRIS